MTTVVYRFRYVMLGFERRCHGDDFKDRSQRVDPKRGAIEQCLVGIFKQLRQSVTGVAIIGVKEIGVKPR